MSGPAPWMETWEHDEATQKIVQVGATEEYPLPVVRTDPDGPEMGRDRGVADMRLLAAAPDLYRALDRFMRGNECRCKGNIIPGGPCPHQQARDALRKARGEQ